MSLPKKELISLPEASENGNKYWTEEEKKMTIKWMHDTGTEDFLTWRKIEYGF